jgi:cellulose synthase/poly-beta-1,6-N-acetylglucosamine synthase-like glycosyltransferase
VDSRPEYDFLIECVRVLKSNESAIIASGARFVTNEDEGIVPKTIAAEYLFFSDVYEEFAIYDGFTHFNGLIGVIDMKLVNSYLPRSLDESVPCEDVEFTQRAYLAGLTSVFTPHTMVGEQAPVSIGDLFNQRVRWLAGAFAGLQKYRSRFFFALIPRTRKLAWFFALSLPFVAFLAIPIVPVYGLRLWAKHGVSRAVVQTAGLIGHTVLITICGLVVIAKRIMGRETEWKDSSRSDV